MNKLCLKTELKHCKYLIKTNSVNMRSRYEFYWNRIPLKKYYSVLKVLKSTKAVDTMYNMCDNQLVIKYKNGNITLNLEV